MLPIRRSKLRAAQVVASDIRLCDVPQDIRDLVDDSKLEGLRTHFTHFDVDQSGYIDSGELMAVMRRMGFNPTEKRISEVLTAYDTDRNGNLSFGEFVEVWAYYCQEAKNEGELVSRAFTFFLPNDCQSVSYSDFKDIMTDIGDALTSEEVDRFFSLVDDESDGILRLDEFMKVLYSDVSDLTHLAGGKDCIQPLFAQSARPQRRSLIQSKNMNNGTELSPHLVNFASFMSDNGGNSPQKGQSSCMGSEAERSPSNDRSWGNKGSRYQRRSSSSRYGHCRSVHVDPSLAGQSARTSSHCSPVRFLRSAGDGPWDPNALAECLCGSSFQQPERVAHQPQEEAQPPAEQEPVQCIAQENGAQDAGHVTWAAHNSDEGVRASDHLPSLFSPRRAAARAAKGCDSRGNKVDLPPTQNYVAASASVPTSQCEQSEPP